MKNFLFFIFFIGFLVSFGYWGVYAYNGMMSEMWRSNAIMWACIFWMSILNWVK